VGADKVKGLFVANGNETIGMGHIMRCMAIAEAMLEKHIHAEYVTKYELGKAFILNKGFNVLLYNNVDELVAALKKRTYDFIVIDSYEVDEGFFKFFRNYAKKLIYIDDSNAFDYPVDIVINTAMGAKNLNYKVSNNKKYLLGSDYCILRKEFRSLKRKPVRQKVEDIFITTGGSDAYNMTYRILDFLTNKLEIKGIKYHVIIGPAFKNSDDLYKAFMAIDDVAFYNSPNNMADIMNKCDIAISAGGNTLYELCSLGIPTIAFVYADNQKQFVESFESEECIESVGYYKNINHEKFENVLFRYIEDYSLRKKISDSQSTLVDGQGVVRIADFILKYANGNAQIETNYK
jgi:UDP-2,4-diacetamido-2,4,6-trideoxy-beta-L-altropyranose hydrolase